MVEVWYKGVSSSMIKGGTPSITFATFFVARYATTPMQQQREELLQKLNHVRLFCSLCRSRCSLVDSAGRRFEGHERALSLLLITK